jgi:FlaG/FlaF family flagellin (archaellin)
MSLPDADPKSSQTSPSGGTGTTVLAVALVIILAAVIVSLVW